jgi:uncharacterized RDD family membrane protein YckC
MIAGLAFVRHAGCLDAKNLDIRQGVSNNPVPPSTRMVRYFSRLFITMTNSLESTTQPVVAYSRTALRIRAYLIDSIVFFGIFAGSALLISMLELGDAMNHRLWLAVLAVLFLYEPVLVAWRGATIGHQRSNLRVVDERTGGKVGIIRAFVRLFIKCLLGWLSFVSMLVMQKRQALHDGLTHTSVRIVDITHASPNQYTLASEIVEVPGMPSVLRRTVVTLVYFVVTYVLFSIALVMFASADCVQARFCSDAERTAATIELFVWLVFDVVLILLGSMGRLPGARIERNQNLR